MGLDGVELVMAVEKEFKIAIADADAAQCVTVGRLVDLVHSRLRHASEEPCPSQHGFYAVRKELMQMLRLKRTAIRPQARLADLIPAENRRATWRNLLHSLTDGKAKWPRLRRPRWATVLVVLAFPAAIAAGLTLLAGWSSLGMALCVAMLTAALADRLSAPLRTEFPDGFTQVQHLIKFVSTLETATWSRDEVFQKIKAIVVEQLGVDESEVTLEAEFVKDLGV
jgi:acyl carrier protein